MRYTPIRMAKMKKTNYIPSWQEGGGKVEELKLSSTAGENVKWYNNLENH